ncbi:SOS response-associated peptidase [Paenibacillus sp. P96]|uniref:Abasic site processing protein n=1 Tax=Paenibacillus zeirhizosphaerae TaxID=2987519 RepID=A0ABT9FRN6_9BACL|nr:SOS response-associated peptidase [Paenibacillus sp. P96]MDP4097395.1 SOS response-associated peptidase [Paenibacillus sp. P96]
MCRRFSLSADLDEVRQFFGISRVMYYYKTRYNMSPTQSVPIVMNHDGEKVLDEFRWGMVPYWGKDCVNADLNTLTVNPAYRKLAETQRCIIPCNGFYYWRNMGKKSCAVRVILPGQQMFALAGLYEVWQDTRKEPMRTCTMVMAPANRTIEEFTSHMPAILSLEEAEQWLNPELRDLNELQTMVQTYDAEEMHAYPVTPMVGNDGHDHEECIKEMDIKLAWVKA